MRCYLFLGACKGSFTIVNIYVLVQRVLRGEGGPRPAYYFLKC